MVSSPRQKRLRILSSSDLTSIRQGTDQRQRRIFNTYVVATRSEPWNDAALIYHPWGMARRGISTILNELERNEATWTWTNIRNERMNERMNEWMNEWLNEWLNEWMSEWVSEWMNEWMNEWMAESMKERMSEWMNEWINTWTERTTEWMNECINEWTSYID